MSIRITLVFLLAVPLWAQNELSLRDAVRLAIRENKAIAGTSAGVRASEARIAQARGGMLPKVNYSESSRAATTPSSSSALSSLNISSVWRTSPSAP